MQNLSTRMSLLMVVVVGGKIDHLKSEVFFVISYPPTATKLKDLKFEMTRFNNPFPFATTTKVKDFRI